MNNQKYKPIGINRSKQEIEEGRRKREKGWDDLIKERIQQQNKSRGTPSSSARKPAK